MLVEVARIFLVLFLTLLGAFCAKAAIRKILPSTGKRFKEFVFFILCVNMIRLPMWVGDENILFVFPFLMVGFLVCSSGTMLERVVLGIVFYSLQVPINMLVDSFVNIPALREIETIVTTSMKSIFCLCMLLFLNRIIPKHKLIQLPNSLWLLIGGLCMAPLFAIFVFSILHPLAILTDIELFDEIRKEYTIIAYFVLPWVSLSAMMILNAIVILGKHELLKKEQELADMRKLYYDRLKQEQQQTKTLRHDMRNHMTIVQTMIMQGKVENTLDYIEMLNDSKALIGRLGFCENEIADIVLSSKAEQMESEQISYEIKVELPKELSISELDLCSLLGNALDNSIEAVRKATDKRVLVRARVDKGMFMLRVENTVEGEVNLQNNHLRTTKENKKEHGFGIAGMKDIAEKNQGYLQIQSKQGTFELLVSIPLRNPKTGLLNNY